MTSPRPKPTGREPPSTEAAVHAAVGLHDPVRADRRHRARDVDHPGRAVRSSTPTARRSRAPTKRSTSTRSGSSSTRSRRRSTASTASRTRRPATSTCSTAGELFGAIDVAFFILVIGGFIGDHDEDRRDPGRHRRCWSRRLHGRERWMIPILMTVFALGGTTFGMAEESLAFYVLDHHGDDRRRVRRARRRAGDPARLRDRGARLDGQPVRDRHRVGLRRRAAERRARCCASSSSSSAWRSGIWFVLRYAERVRQRPDEVARVRHEGRQRAHFAAAPTTTRRVVLTGRQKLILDAVRRRVRGDGLRRHPVGGPRHRPADAVVVVPGDDGVVPALRDPHRRRRRHARGRAHLDVRRRGARPPRCRPDHRHRPRHHRGDEQRPDHRHRAALGRGGARRRRRGRVRRSSCTCCSCRCRS